MGIYAHGVFAVNKKARILVAVLVFAALGAGLGWLVLRSSPNNNASPSQDQLKNTTQVRTLVQQTAKDSDGDGLKDWEEAIWHTDLARADTDGDGTSDGEEINLQRDPLKKGPKDALAALLALEQLKNTADTPEKPNLTLDLTQSLLESGVLNAVDPQGNLTATDFLNKLTLPEGISPDDAIESAAVIRPKDIITSSDNTQEAIKVYFNSIYAAYMAHILPAQRKRGDLAILIQALDTQRFERLAELDPIIQALGRTIRDIRKIPVPPDQHAFAVRELNYLLQIKRAVEILRNTESDPLATALILQKRIELSQEMYRFHQETKSALTKKGIAFKPDEGGYAYFQ